MRLGYSGAHAVRQTKYAKNKQEAQEKLLEMHQRALSGSNVKPSRLTLEDFAKRWLRDYVQLRCRETTYVLYRFLLSKHVIPYIGTARLQRVSPEMLQALYAKLERNGASERLRQMVHVRLHKLFKTAQRWKLVSQNPCDSIDPPRVPKAPVRYYDVDQAKSFLEAIKGDRYEALYAVAIGTGMRQGELFALQWPNVDLRAGTISIQFTLQDTGQGPLRRELKTKNSSRMVALPEFALEALRKHRKTTLSDGSSSDWVFSDQLGGPLRKSNFIRREFKQAIRRSGLPELHFHGLRHTAATLLLSQGVNAKVVQEMLGHSTVSMTLDTYSHVTPSLQRSAANALNELMRDQRMAT